MINKVIKFTAQVLDGQILECPITISIPCDQIKPIGQQTIYTMWKVTGCIVAMSVFLVNVDGKLFGTNLFDKSSFMAYYYANCKCCSEAAGCHLLINGCAATMNGCEIIF